MIRVVVVVVALSLRLIGGDSVAPSPKNFERWLDAVGPTLLPSEPPAATIGYYQQNEAALFRFIDDTRVPIDASPTQRGFQNVANLRLDMPCAGSTEGAHRACVLLGIVASSRAQRRSRSAG